LVSRRDFF